MDPKLVLSWLLTTLGAPPHLIGWLVPLREAGSLFPQMLIAGRIRSLPQRKWVWSAGGVVQGLCLAAMGAAALSLDGAQAGWTILGLLAVFACARSAVSLSYKDVLGRTVAKATRGSAAGTAASIAAALVLAFGALLSTGLLEKSVVTIASALFLAALLWLVAAGVFATLSEAGGATEPGGVLSSLGRQASLLVHDRPLLRFILTRALLTATALAPPYLVTLSGETGGKELGRLGPFVIASALASVSSGYVWGRLSDRSSRKVLALSGALAALFLGVTAGMAVYMPHWFGARFTPPILLFGLMIAYQGVRLGRATHIVDMADDDTRAAYTAVSNTVIGVVLMAGGLFGWAAEAGGEALVLAIFAGMCFAATAAAFTLEEVQRRA